jgi:hypothetical protein
LVVDADIFLDEDGCTYGPLAAYVPLAEKFPDQVLLLPHAAADTDHPTRGDGATQAIDQIRDAIDRKEIRNLRGDLPDGYTLGSKSAPIGVGGVKFDMLRELVADPFLSAEMAGLAERVAGFWSDAYNSTPAGKEPVIDRKASAEMLEALNRLQSLGGAFGLRGPLVD